MTPRTSITTRSQREHLRRLSVLFSVAIRLKIVAELYARPMSPKEFVESFGGGTVERIWQHFKRLEEYGWLRRVGITTRRGTRRGRSETIYRATDLAFFDSETWALVPYSARLATSWNMFTATACELREAIERTTDRNDPRRDLTCETLELDSVGWQQAIGLLDSRLASTLEEQEDARIRIGHTGEHLTRVGVLQLGFEAEGETTQMAAQLAESPALPPVPFPERLAPILADDLCMEVLRVLNERELSVKGFQREIAPDVKESVIRHRFDRLRDLAWAAVVRTVKKRGAEEKIYRATRPAILANGPWSNVSASLARTDSWSAFIRLTELAKASITAGTFDLRYDRHVSWSIVHVDQAGRENNIAKMEKLAAGLRKIEQSARGRIESGANPLCMVVALGVLESPISPIKAP